MFVLEIGALTRVNLTFLRILGAKIDVFGTL